MLGKRILVVGSLNMDVVSQMEYLPSPGETVLGTGLRHVPGGKGANQAFAAARLGGHVTMLGCVGADEYGSRLLGSIQKAGANVDNVESCAGEFTGTAFIWVSARGENSIVVIPGANAQCNTAYLDRHRALFQACDYLLLQMEIPLESVYYAIDLAHSLGKKIILNPAPMPENIDFKRVAGADYLTPNETELERLYLQRTGSGAAFPRHAEMAGKLAQDLGTCLLVTLGESGALLADGKSTRHYPAEPANAVDTTAAGDCFNAAFAVGLAEGMTEAKAIAFANKAASLAVTREGAQSSLPCREEVE